MIGGVRCSQLLRGYRGAKPADVDALREIVLRVSSLLTTCPEIAELDINPVKVLERGAVVVDARVRVERMVPGPASRRIAY
jgi:acyl-CoA synthetase (NDP forming)